MEHFIVFDTKGAGRPVGIFDSEAKALAVQRVNPHYFRIHSGRMNQVNPEIVNWALSEQEHRGLERLIESGKHRS